MTMKKIDQAIDKFTTDMQRLLRQRIIEEVKRAMTPPQLALVDRGKSKLGPSPRAR